MSERDKLIRDLFARANAAGRRVFGYSSERAGCEEARTAKPKGKSKSKKDEDVKPGIIPAEWDRLCVEGDSCWTCIPLAKGAEQGKE